MLFAEKQILDRFFSYKGCLRVFRGLGVEVELPVARSELQITFIHLRSPLWLTLGRVTGRANKTRVWVAQYNLLALMQKNSQRRCAEFINFAISAPQQRRIPPSTDVVLLAALLTN